MPSWSHGEGLEEAPSGSVVRGCTFSCGVLIAYSSHVGLWQIGRGMKQISRRMVKGSPKTGIFIETPSLSATGCKGLQSTSSSIDLIMLTLTPSQLN